MENDINKWILNLETNDVLEQMVARQALTQAGEAAVMPLLTALSSGSVGTRCGILHILLGLTGRGALDKGTLLQVLEAALDDPAEAVKYDAGQILYRIGNKRGLLELERLIEEGSEEYSEKAARAICNNPCREALQVLRRLSQQKEGTALGELAQQALISLDIVEETRPIHRRLDGLPVIPRMIGPYEVIEPLGKVRRFGTKEYEIGYRAIEKFGQVEVGLEYLGDFELLNLDDRELAGKQYRVLTSASQVDSPLITPLLGIFSYTDMDLQRETSQKNSPFNRLYAAYPLESNRTLRELLDKYHGRPFSLEEVTRIIENVSRALALCESQGFSHGRLNPEDITISESGQVRVRNFGISQLRQFFYNATFGAYDSNEPLYFELEEYCSPEEINQNNFRSFTASAKSDQYSLALVVYEMLSGGENPLRSRKNHTGLSFEEIEAALPQIPGPVVRVLAKALAEESQKRFESSLLFAAALAEACRLR
ncbi:MAG TPA: protein kinase [Chloroflexia bacterium]|nr:protein kinase [Chloroflexia bacterium]